MKTVSLTTGVLLVYIVISTLPVPFAVVFLLFLITTGLFLRMVYSVLTDPYPGNRTFDSHFYEDVDIRPGQNK